jgi:hypothetical protein
MAESPLSPLLSLSPAEIRDYLISLAREERSAALETLRCALEVPALAEAAVEALGEVPEQEAWDLLEQAAQGRFLPGLRKAARRAQHRLRSRGFSPAVVHPTRPPEATGRAWASYFDRRGDQYLRLIRPAPLGLLRFAGFIVSPQGLDTAAAFLAGREEIEGLLAEEDERFGDRMVEVGLPYVARRVRQAAARSREQGQALPEDYPEAARLLEDIPEDVEPEELLSIPEVPPSQDEVDHLFSHPSMFPWLFPRETLKPYVEEWLKAVEHLPPRTEEGLLNLGIIQARGRIAARILADLYDEDLQARLPEQLREQARLLYALGEKELAGIARRCASALGTRPAAEDPFLRVLVDTSMALAVSRFVEEEEEEEEEEPWIPVEGPGGFLWVPRSAEGEEGGEEEEGEPPPRLWLPGQE